MAQFKIVNGQPTIIDDNGNAFSAAALTNANSQPAPAGEQFMSPEELAQTRASQVATAQAQANYLKTISDQANDQAAMNALGSISATRNAIPEMQARGVDMDNASMDALNKMYDDSLQNPDKEKTLESAYLAQNETPLQTATSSLGGLAATPVGKAGLDALKEQQLADATSALYGAKKDKIDNYDQTQSDIIQKKSDAAIALQQQKAEDAAAAQKTKLDAQASAAAATQSAGGGPGGMGAGAGGAARGPGATVLSRLNGITDYRQQNQKVSAAAHAMTLINQMATPDGGFDATKPQAAELAMTMANLVSGSSSHTVDEFKSMNQQSLQGSIVSAYNQLTGSNLNTLPKGWADMYKETIGRQGAVAQTIRDGYVDPVVDAVTAGIGTPQQVETIRAAVKHMGVDFLSKYPQYNPDGTTKQPPASGGSAAPVKINGDADYNALPSGATFIGPDGKTRTKP